MLVEEEYPHVVSGSYRSHRHARESAQSLVDTAGIAPQQVMLVAPQDPQVERKVEPDSRGIFKTLLKAHLGTAVTGFFLGLGIALALVFFGPPWARSSPVLVLTAFALTGTLASALLGGLITLRPDRYRVARKAMKESLRGDWTVVAHCRDANEKSKVAHVIGNDDADLRRSM